jgi:hypothetical protein
VSYNDFYNITITLIETIKLYLIFRELMTELQARLKELTDDHARKSQAFSLDSRCMGVREQLSKDNLRPKSEGNLKLTGTLRNTSRFLENSTACV